MMGDSMQQEPEAAGHSTSTVRTQRDTCILISLSFSAYRIPDPSQGTSSPRVKMAVPLSVKIVPHRHAQSPSARWFWILSSWQLILTITRKNLTSMPLHQAPLKCPSLSCWICLRIGAAWATHTFFFYVPPSINLYFRWLSACEHWSKVNPKQSWWQHVFTDPILWRNPLPCLGYISIHPRCSSLRIFYNLTGSAVSLSLSPF